MKKMAIWVFFLTIIIAAAPCASAANHLNNGEKWVADAHTVNIATNMNALLDTFEGSGEERTLFKLQALGESLKENFNELIRGCTMTGPAHEQLHIWLLGIAPDIEKLRDAQTITQANESYHTLRLKLAKFWEYFILSELTQSTPTSHVKAAPRTK